MLSDISLLNISQVHCILLGDHYQTTLPSFNYELIETSHINLKLKYSKIARVEALSVAVIVSINSLPTSTRHVYLKMSKNILPMTKETSNIVLIVYHSISFIFIFLLLPVCISYFHHKKPTTFIHCTSVDCACLPSVCPNDCLCHSRVLFMLSKWIPVILLVASLLLVLLCGYEKVQ